MYFDYTYLILVMPAALLAMLASYNVKNTFKKYSRVYSKRGMSGAQVARMILDYNGLSNIRVEEVAGDLSDHYEHDKRVIRLSDRVYHSNSVAALGVAAHEVGHAIQYKEGYAPIQVRNMIIPLTQIGSKLSIPLLMAGLILSSFSQKLIFLSYVGIALFATVAIFQIVTLPSEFDASRRAMIQLENMNFLDQAEAAGARKVLNAAALTYVAALAVTLMQLLRFIILVSGRSRD